MRVIRSMPMRLAALSVSVMAVAACGSDSGSSGSSGSGGKAKVAFVMTESLKTSNLGKASQPGLDQAEKQYGIEVAVSDSQTPAQMRDTLRDYGGRGYELVIANGASLQAPVLEVAKQFPDTTFMVVNGNKAQAPNAGAVDFRWEQGGFMAGLLAGLTTKRNKVGGLGSVHIPPIERLLDGFEQGVSESNPKAEVTTAYSGTFTDVAANKETALALISRGSDVIFTVATAGDPGVFQATDEKGVWGIGYGTDEASLGPKSVISSMVVDYGRTIFDVVRNFHDKSLQPKVYVYGFDEDVLGMTPYRHLSPALEAKAKKLVERAKKGEFDIKSAGGTAG